MLINFIGRIAIEAEQNLAVTSGIYLTKISILLCCVVVPFYFYAYASCSRSYSIPIHFNPIMFMTTVTNL